MRRFFLVGLAACSTKAPVGDSGGGGPGGADEITWPSGDRVLLYNGNGGVTAERWGTASFDDLDTWLHDTYGWHVDLRDYFPQDKMDSYRMIGLVAPEATAQAPFADSDVALFQEALDRGTRLVVFGDVSMCDSSAVSDLLEALGVSIRFSGDAVDANRVVQTTSINTSAQPGTGVSSLEFIDPCYVETNDGTTLVTDPDRHPLAAAERPGNAGDVLVVGDFQFMDDEEGHLDRADNAVFAANLAAVKP